MSHSILKNAWHFFKIKIKPCSSQSDRFLLFLLKNSLTMDNWLQVYLFLLDLKPVLCQLRSWTTVETGIDWEKTEPPKLVTGYGIIWEGFLKEENEEKPISGGRKLYCGNKSYLMEIIVTYVTNSQLIDMSVVLPFLCFNQWWSICESMHLCIYASMYLSYVFIHTHHTNILLRYSLRNGIVNSSS